MIFIYLFSVLLHTFTSATDSIPDVAWLSIIEPTTTLQDSLMEDSVKVFRDIAPCLLHQTSLPFYIHGKDLPKDYKRFRDEEKNIFFCTHFLQRYGGIWVSKHAIVKNEKALKELENELENSQADLMIYFPATLTINENYIAIGKKGVRGVKERLEDFRDTFGRIVSYKSSSFSNQDSFILNSTIYKRMPSSVLEHTFSKISPDCKASITRESREWKRAFKKNSDIFVLKCVIPEKSLVFYYTIRFVYIIIIGGVLLYLLKMLFNYFKSHSSNNSSSLSPLKKGV